MYGKNLDIYFWLIQHLVQMMMIVCPAGLYPLEILMMAMVYPAV
jgi:hypothetical protein